ncbi:MFS transporter [Amycolatopsis sp. NPDC059021]|uniref:MFS transporter n=1 Tax=Amycolatopsis sp. NPDC059021 TaxID=3346704 RepID=UPI00366BD48B
MSVKLPRAFSRLWAASAVSTVGDGVLFAAAPLLAVGISGDPMVVSLVTFAVMLPWPLCGLFCGALVDRWDRRRTMWIADLARAALLGIAVVAGVSGVLGIPVLMVLAFLLGLGQVFFDTAAQAYLPTLLGRDQPSLRRANAWLRGAQTAGEGFVGPPAGSALFALGRMVPFAVDAVSFVLSAVLIRTLPAAPADDETRRPLWTAAREGARYLVRDRILLGLALRPAVGNFAFAGAGAVMVLYARDALQLDATGYGVLLTTEAVGGLLGAFLAGPLERLLGTGGALTATAAIEASAVLGMGLAPNAVLAGVAYAVCGCGMAATMVLGPSVRQAIVPERLMGRVAAATRLVAVSAGPVGALFGGWLASNAGVRAPYVAGAAVLATMTIVTASMTSNRRIEAALAAARSAEAPVG